MAVNKKTVILLVLAVAIWAVAIFVLIRMNTKPQTSAAKSNAPSTPTQSGTTQIPVQAGQNVQQNPASPAAQATNPATQTVNIANLSLAEIENMIPESTFSDFLTPYKLDLKVNLSSSLFQGAIQETTSYEANRVEGRENGSVKPVQQPVQQATPSKPSTAETINLSTAELIDVEGIYYVGYMAIQDDNKEIKRIYVQIGEETKSYLENELVSGIYKILQISPTYLIVLDTNDGRIKRIKQIE